MAEQGAQDKTAHPKAEAEERAKASIRLANSPADDPTAGTMASVGPGFWAIIAAGAITALAPILTQGLLSGLTEWLAAFGCSTVSVGVAAAMLGKRRPVYLTVTEDELICYRVPKMNQQPSRAGVLFRMSPRTARLDGRKDKKGASWTINFASRSPSAKGRPQQHHTRVWPGLHQSLQRSLTIDRSWYRN
jgi:hypothetical protein